MGRAKTPMSPRNLERKRVRDERIAAGRCFNCGVLRDDPALKIRCTRCNDRHRCSDATLREFHRIRGGCAFCGRKTDGAYRCGVCTRKRNRRDKRARARKRKEKKARERQGVQGVPGGQKHQSNRPVRPVPEQVRSQGGASPRPQGLDGGQGGMP